jgi:hypothetical protein
MRHATSRTTLAALGAALVLAACTGTDAPEAGLAPVAAAPSDGPDGTPGETGTGVVTLAFAGDVHFPLHLAALLDRPRAGLGPVDRVLGDADVTMVNLESAITERGTPEAKEREVPEDRYHFRTSARALDVLAAAGVDVVGVANNHGADYGPVGVRDTLRAARTGPVAVVGVGRDRDAAFRPHRVTVRGTEVAFLAADQSFREGASSVWEAGPDTPGIAAARGPRPRALLGAVRAAAQRSDVVVVYLHWGRELRACPTTDQRTTARALARAGADVVVGSHAHVLLGSGWLDGSYVSYGLGNFVWYHDHQAETGVLRLRVEDGGVVAGEWVPAWIGTWGRPLPLRGDARAEAVADWRGARGCAGLAARP